jgi:hypothetical protein
VILPLYVCELALAHADADSMPGGDRFWQAMCEEALANYLWQHAELPDGGILRVEDLSSTLRQWIDNVLTVELSDKHAS